MGKRRKGLERFLTRFSRGLCSAARVSFTVSDGAGAFCALSHSPRTTPDSREAVGAAPGNAGSCPLEASLLVPLPATKLPSRLSGRRSTGFAEVPAQIPDGGDPARVPLLLLHSCFLRSPWKDTTRTLSRALPSGRTGQDARRV